ncbi:MAG: GNAT family N-acetyltransferase [Thermoplasmata archaeon]|nr:MAG: GNAT family N-acetyltransferase [Thermoplasmata archaeon]
MAEKTIAIPEDISLETNRLILRPLKDQDSESIYKNVKEYDIAKWTISIPHPYPKEGAMSFIQQSKKHMQSGLAYHFAILSKDNSELMGVMSLIGVNMRHKNAELGYWVGKYHWNKGIATEAASRMLEFGFQDLNLQRISARCFHDNTPSIRVIEKIGMKYEGKFRKEILKENKFIDMAYYAILKEEWNR